MNKFFLGLAAISLSFVACQNGKNSANNSNNKKDLLPQKEVLITTTTRDIKNDNDTTYYDEETATKLLFEYNWELVSYTYSSGATIDYKDLKIYDFGESSIEFTDNFPNDCNTCSAAAEYNIDKQLISVKRGSSRPCTELECGVSSPSIDNIVNKPLNPFNVVFEENMSYKIRRNNTLELYISKGHYTFQLYTSLREKQLKNLNNTSWEIVAYRDIQKEPSGKFKPLEKAVPISFDANSYKYAPGCNTCWYMLKDFSSNNGVITWDEQAKVNSACTLLACLDEERELPGEIISNGMTYVIDDDYLYLSDNKYRLKLRPLKLK